MGSRGYLSLALVALVVLSALVLSGCSCAPTRRISPEEYRGDGPTSPLPKQEPAGPLLSRAEEIEIFKNSNDGVVRAGSTKPVTFTLAQQTSISYIQTYHWDSGKPPGEISLRGEDGTIYGPWKAVGTEGQGGMPNAYWEVTPNQSLKPGTYTVVDSDPGSWSTNDQMGGLGQTIVRGYSEE